MPRSCRGREINGYRHREDLSSTNRVSRVRMRASAQMRLASFSQPFLHTLGAAREWGSLLNRWSAKNNRLGTPFPRWKSTRCIAFPAFSMSLLDFSQTLNSLPNSHSQPGVCVQCVVKSSILQLACPIRFSRQCLRLSFLAVIMPFDLKLPSALTLFSHYSTNFRPSLCTLPS